MSMLPLDIKDAKKAAKRLSLYPGRMKGTYGVEFTDRKDPRYELISWREMEKCCNERGLTIYLDGQRLVIR